MLEKNVRRRILDQMEIIVSSKIVQFYEMVGIRKG